MSDGNALIRAVLDDPDDDAPRLIYADWLEERGEHLRAQFIRAQVELARLPPDHVDRDRLVQVERTLWKANRAAWTAWVPNWVRFDRFHRGFLEEIRCDAADFLAHAEMVRRQSPILAAWLEKADHVAVPLFRGPALQGLRSLRIRDNVPAGAWSIFAESPYLSQLTRLQLGESSEPMRLIEALIASQALPALRTLRLKNFPLGDEPVARLVGHPWCTRLEVLDLSQNYCITQADALVASQHLDGLKQLDLRRTHLIEDRLAVEALRRRFGERVRL